MIFIQKASPSKSKRLIVPAGHYISRKCAYLTSQSSNSTHQNSCYLQDRVSTIYRPLFAPAHPNVPKPPNTTAFYNLIEGFSDNHGGPAERRLFAFCALSRSDDFTHALPEPIMRARRARLF